MAYGFVLESFCALCVPKLALSFLCRFLGVLQCVSSLLLFHLNVYQEVSLFPSGKVPCMQEKTAKSLLLVNYLKKKIDGIVYSLCLCST